MGRGKLGLQSNILHQFLPQIHISGWCKGNKQFASYQLPVQSQIEAHDEHIQIKGFQEPLITFSYQGHWICIKQETKCTDILPKLLRIVKQTPADRHCQFANLMRVEKDSTYPKTSGSGNNHIKKRS